MTDAIAAGWPHQTPGQYHAAHHDGALPESLAELRLPAPEDPMTGEPFGYAVSGSTFTLTAPRYLENDANSNLEWRVTMRR